MVVCKYFLEGRCYFGDNCRNEHSYAGRPAPSYYNAAGRQQQVQQQQQQQQTIRNTNEVKQLVVEEIRAMEAGHQWPFSCFSPLKNEVVVPDMDDISPEELRCEAYLAQSQNNFEDYKRKVARLKQEYQNKLNQLVNMDANTLRDISQGGKSTNTFGSTVASSSSSFQGGNVFVNQPAASSFSFSSLSQTPPQQPSQNVFGATSFNQPSSTFGQAASFGNKLPIANVFGQASAAPTFNQPSVAPPPAYTAPPAYNQTSNVFGQAQPVTNSTNVFGQAQSSSNVFGQPQPSAANVFGQSQANVFGQQQAAPASTSLFGQSQPVGASVFGQSQPTSAFGQAQPVMSTPTTAFGQAQPIASTPANVFGQAQPTASTPNAFGQAPNVFGNPQPQSSGFGQNQFTGQPPAFGEQTPPKSLFSQQTAPSATSFSQVPSANTFNTPAASVFGQQPSSFTGTASTPPQNVFNSAVSTPPQNVFSQPSNTFTQTPFAQQQQQSDKVNPFTQAAATASATLQNHYSKLEDLSEEDIAAFQADEFILGKIPTKPPPLEIA